MFDPRTIISSESRDSHTDFLKHLIRLEQEGISGNAAYLFGDGIPGEIGGVFTTEHAASAYGLPVFVVTTIGVRGPDLPQRGSALGPADVPVGPGRWLGKTTLGFDATPIDVPQQYRDDPRMDAIYAAGYTIRFVATGIDLF